MTPPHPINPQSQEKHPFIVLSENHLIQKKILSLR